MTKSAYLLCFTIALAIPILTYPTCIVIFNYKNVIYVAADSKRHFPTGDQTICKIHRVGNVYLSVSSLSDPLFTPLADAAIKIKGPLKLKMANLKRVAIHFYDSIFRARPELYNVWGIGVNDTYPVAYIGFFSFINGKAVLNKMTVHIVRSIMGNTPDVGANQEYNLKMAILGADSHTYDSTMLEVSQIYKSTADWLERAKQMVELERKYDTVNIGIPIRLFKLSSNGEDYKSSQSCPFVH